MGGDSELERPDRCGLCAKFFRDKKNPGYGWCDNWGGVQLCESDVCHPNMGVALANVDYAIKERLYDETEY